MAFRTKPDVAIKVASRVYAVSEEGIRSPSRNRKRTALARQVAMFLHYTHSSRGYCPTGRDFNRDHKTVMFAVKKIRELEQSGDSDVLAAIKMYHELSTPAI